jgi:hypothetical protein
VFLALCSGGEAGAGDKEQGADKDKDISEFAGRAAPGEQPAVLTSPAPGIKFSKRSATFVWTNTGANEYRFTLRSGSLVTPVVDTVTSGYELTVTTLPTMAPSSLSGCAPLQEVAADQRIPPRPPATPPRSPPRPSPWSGQSCFLVPASPPPPDGRVAVVGGALAHRLRQTPMKPTPVFGGARTSRHPCR